MLNYLFVAYCQELRHSTVAPSTTWETCVIIFGMCQVPVVILQHSGAASSMQHHISCLSLTSTLLPPPLALTNTLWVVCCHPNAGLLLLLTSISHLSGTGRKKQYYSSLRMCYSARIYIYISDISNVLPTTLP